MSDNRSIQTLGNADILNHRMVALLSSVKCPGRIILETYDLCQRLRSAGVTVVSGFHSPMEKECLRILLNSPHAVVWCLARGMIKRVPPDLCRASVEGRLLIVSPFPDTVRRVTAQGAVIRNRRVAEMADQVVIPYAAPGSKIEQLSLEILGRGKPLYTFDCHANEKLLELGAKPVEELAI